MNYREVDKAYIEQPFVTSLYPFTFCRGRDYELILTEMNSHVSGILETSKRKLASKMGDDPT